MSGTFATADLCDAHEGEVLVLALPWRDYGARRRFSGPVSTVLAFEDNSRVREAVQEPGEGRVLLVDGQGSLERAMLGDNLANAAAANGWSGIVVAGAIRDSAVIAGIDLGVKALGTVPCKTDRRGAGERDVVLRFGPHRVAPGDWLYSDEDGVIIASRRLG